jgi:hypothetical protein
LYPDTLISSIHASPFFLSLVYFYQLKDLLVIILIHSEILNNVCDADPYFGACYKSKFNCPFFSAHISQF